MVKILVVYYSKYGHTLQLAKAVAEGAGAIADAEILLRRVQEFAELEQELPKDEYARPVWEEQQQIPVCTIDDLRAADGIVFGSPTRYGSMIAQMKSLIDSTGGIWMKGELEGKPAGVFTSTATTHGGQESTLLSMMVPLLHLGMVIVGVPYSTSGMLHTEGRGGTPYGSSTVAGSKNELKPTAGDLDIARAQGKRVAEMAAKLRS